MRWYINLFFSIYVVSFVPFSVPVNAQIIQISEQEEKRIGEEEYRKLLNKSYRSADEQLNETIRQIGRRIASVASKPGLPYEFNILVDKRPNAFCLPGGKVAVYTGMIQVAGYEARLATVMSHEIAHATLRHGAKKMTMAMQLNLLEQSLNELMNKGKVKRKKRELLKSIWGLGSNYFAALPYGRKMEYAADAYGLLYMAAAGYDPRQAVEFWEIMSKSGTKMFEFLSTHPSDENRIVKLRESLPIAMKLYNNSKLKIEGMGQLLSFNGKYFAPEVQNFSKSGLQQPINLPAAKFEAIWIEHNVQLNNTYGFTIHSTFTISNYKGRDGFMNVYFSFPNGKWLLSRDNTYQAQGGYVVTSSKFRPKFPNTKFTDFKGFIPYHELHLQKGFHNIVANVNIVDPKNNLLGRTSTYLNVVSR